MHINFFSAVYYVPATLENSKELTFSQHLVNFAEAVFAMSDTYALSPKVDNLKCKNVLKYETPPPGIISKLAKVILLIGSIATSILFPPLAAIPASLAALFAVKLIYRLKNTFVCDEEKSHLELVKNVTKELKSHIAGARATMEKFTIKKFEELSPLKCLFVDIEGRANVLKQAVDSHLATRMPSDLQHEIGSAERKIEKLKITIQAKINDNKKLISEFCKNRFAGLERQMEDEKELTIFQIWKPLPSSTASLNIYKPNSNVDFSLDPCVKARMNTFLAPIGLRNNGYICYLNSCLQLLMNVPSLNRKLIGSAAVYEEVFVIIKNLSLRYPNKKSRKDGVEWLNQKLKHELKNISGISEIRRCSLNIVLKSINLLPKDDLVCGVPQY